MIVRAEEAPDYDAASAVNYSNILDDMVDLFGDETITFEYRTTSRGTVDEYECSCCGCYIYFPAYDTYASEKIDYDYCPYCGKPVAKE